MLPAMCGIAGLAGEGAQDCVALARMAHAMAHRGPDGRGIWHDDEVGMAFRRLAIIDLDERSNQPFHLDDLHLVFNGEIYNYIELRSELQSLGHVFVTEGDAEVLLHAWAAWGDGALDRLNGMFAFAVWDATSRKLVLATDRFAEKPLFVHCRPGQLAFASDIRALRAADGTIGIPDRRATNAFLALAVMPKLPRTFFVDVQRLPPAHVASWDGSQLHMRRWWQPSEVEVPRHPTDAADELRNLLIDSVSLRLRSDVPVGTSLSGGVDSSSVVAVSSKLVGDHRRHAFTATFPSFERDEFRYANAVSEATDVKEHHAVMPQLDELLRDVEDLVASQEEPFVSTSIYAQRRVMEAARQHGVAVLLDGQGADELFAGYPDSRGWALRSRGLRAALSGVTEDRSLIELVAGAYAAGRLPRKVAVRSRMRNASPYFSRHLAGLAAREPELSPDWDDYGTPLRRELMDQAFRSSLPDLCRFVDRNSMAFGLEVRLPFLDYRIAEFGLSASAELLYRDGVTKRVLRDAMRGLVPDTVLDRRDKIAYETPEERWLSSHEGRSWIADVLLDPSSGTGIDREEVEKDLAKSSWRDVGAIWRAVNVELWLRAWSSNQARPKTTV
jgi:asparagine synthase (glutamine-hydrolysing)